MNPLVAANTAFALQLYGKLRSTAGNLALSPYSISSAVAMTYAGARGDTARQIEQTLHFDRCKAGVHELFGGLDAALKTAPGSNELNIANSLWPQAKYPFREDFLNLLKKDYGAAITPLNYEREAERARATINQWVDGQTRHKIAEIIGPGVLDGLTRMVLINAIYFKGMWWTPFPEARTQPDKFYARPGRTLTVPFMHDFGHFDYGENKQLQMLALPYAGGQLEMIVLLPRRRNGIGSLESSLTPASLTAWTSGMWRQRVDVALPKFKISSGFTLAPALKALGLKDAFDLKRADFSGMDGRAHWLYLSTVLHQAFIEVNETGTEAAAATFISYLGASLGARPVTWEFRANHPFLFLIRERATGSLLFMGRVVEPRAAGLTA
ncbi:MAG: serpin family protein [Verrucomicrobia subdivision 3 bacterium]|nr:serpin family protein [Limisphaerales bacterium]